jgi:hypothetical protein
LTKSPLQKRRLLRAVDRLRAIGNPFRAQAWKKNRHAKRSLHRPRRVVVSGSGPLSGCARSDGLRRGTRTQRGARAGRRLDKAIKAADIGFGQAAFWEEAFGSLGVGPGVTAVAYDAGGMTSAARVWFVLQFFGVPCLIANGGWPALAASGIPAGAGPAGGGLQLLPGAGAVGVLDRETLKGQLDGAAHVFDSRTRAEFTGEDSRGRPIDERLGSGGQSSRWVRGPYRADRGCPTGRLKPGSRGFKSSLCLLNVLHM